MAYQAVIKVEGTIHRLKAPFSIGKSAKNSIMLDCADDGDIFCWIKAVSGILRAYDENGNELSLNKLKSKKIQLLGVWDEYHSGLKKLLAWEKQLEVRLPAILSALLLYAFPQGLRFGTFILALVCSILFLDKEGDRAASDLPDSEGSSSLEILQEGFTSKTVFSNKHRSGVVFEVQVDSNEAEKPAKISFNLGGMNKRGAVEIYVNGSLLYKSPLIEDCIRFACPQELLVPPGYINTGVNRLGFRHVDPIEKWILYGVKFQSYRPMNLLEQRRFQLYMEEAVDLFEKRDISPYNLISSGRILRKVKNFSRALYLNSGQRTSFEILDKEVKKNIDKFLKDFWFNNERKISIGYLKEAQDDLMELSRYFPDAASIQGKKIEQQLDRIHSLMGEQ